MSTTSMLPSTQGVAGVSHEHARAWLAKYGELLCAGDSDAIARLFSEDAVWLSSPAEEPVVGRDSILLTYREALAESTVIDTVWTDPVCGLSAAAEWWISMTETPGGPVVTEPGALFFDLDADGLCTSWRAYPFIAPWRRPVPDWWPVKPQVAE